MATKRPAPPRTAPWAWAAVGAALGTVLAAILFAPATWLAHVVAGASNQQVLLADARGTVWNGSARLVLTGGAGSTEAAALPGRIDWRLRPRWNGAGLQVKADCCMPAGVGMRVRLRPGGMQLAVGASRMQWPAAMLTGLGTPWNTLQFDGDLQLSTQGVSVEWSAGRLAVTGGAELVARAISSRLSTVRPMGSYRILLLGGAAPQLRLETIEGPLQLSGIGQWIGQRLRFRGEASAAPERETALSNLLNIIGRRSGPRSIISIG